MGKFLSQPTNVPTLTHKLEEIRGAEAEKNKAGEAMKSTFVLLRTGCSFFQAACVGGAASCTAV